MPDRKHIPVAIIGGGQAGLSTSYYLQQNQIDHIIFERHTRFHSWRVNRWDTFCLVTPNWQCRLPNFPYNGDDPNGFMVKDEIVEYLEAFTATFDPPILENVEVTKVKHLSSGLYHIDTSAGNYIADDVIIATGGYDKPIEPNYMANLSADIMQMNSVDYRNPNQIPEGETLIIGTGQSGVQLMEDLHLAGRKVHLAVGPAPRSPRQYRGRDAIDWLYDTGHYSMTIDKHPDPVAAVSKTNHYMTGRDGGHEIDLRKFALEGVQLYGSVSNMEGDKVSFLPDLTENLDDADASYLGIRNMIDKHIAENGIVAPTEPPFEKAWVPPVEITQIDARESNITSVIWAIGFRPDYSWIDVDVFDERGKPKYTRGVCDIPGIYFIGLGWLNTWGSGRFLGVDEDSKHLVEQLLSKREHTALLQKAS